MLKAQVKEHPLIGGVGKPWQQTLLLMFTDICVWTTMVQLDSAFACKGGDKTLVHEPVCVCMWRVCIYI